VDPESPHTRKSVAKLELDHSPYLHAFGLTQRHAVIPMNTKVTMPAMDKRAYMSEMMSGIWEGVYLVDLEDGSHNVFNCSQFNHLHVANTFENATGVTMDAGSSPHLAVYQFNLSLTTTALIRNKTARDAIRTKGGLYELTRYHLHTAGPLAGQCTSERISKHGRHTEFFRIDDRQSGKNTYCVYYAVEWFHDDASYGAMAVLKHNFCSGERKYWYHENVYPSEAIFVPSPSSIEEDEGVLLFLAHHGLTRKSYFHVLDASTFEELSVSEMPERMGFTAHAQFYANAKRSVVV